MPDKMSPARAQGVSLAQGTARSYALPQKRARKGKTMEKRSPKDTASLDAYWDYAQGKGRGVFARRDLRAGEIVEISPVVVPDAQLFVSESYKPEIDKYILWWSDEKGRECALGLGYLMLYNHAAEKNCEFLRDYERLEITVRTIKDVKAGEELSIHYECPIWFEKA